MLQPLPRTMAAMATLALAGICCAALGLPGCAVHEAATAPALKDLTVLKPGAARVRVIAELGPPVRTEKIGDGRKDVFTFLQGYSTASTRGLATIIAIEDIATLGIADEDLRKAAAARTGRKMTVAVYYDASDVVTGSETILVTQP